MAKTQQKSILWWLL